MTEYDFLFQHTGDAVLLLDSSGCIERINPAAAIMFNVTPDAVCGERPGERFKSLPSLLPLFNPDYDESLTVRLPKRRLATGIGRTFEDGRRMVILHDITEQHDLDSRREQFITSISHDLRNPLSVISGFSELLSVSGDLNADQTYYLDYVKRSTANLFDIAERLVDLAWLEAGMPMPLHTIRLNSVIESAVSDVSARAAERANYIAVSIQDPLPSVLGDERTLRLMLVQLLTNAILYSPLESPIAVHAWGDANGTFCSVADRGMGIDESEMAQVFDRLYRSNRDEVKTIPGGGLGLTLARTIVKRHGGSIWLHSTLGEGSTFTFSLPAASS